MTPPIKNMGKFKYLLSLVFISFIRVPKGPTAAENVLATSAKPPIKFKGTSKVIAQVKQTNEEMLTDKAPMSSLARSKMIKVRILVEKPANSKSKSKKLTYSVPDYRVVQAVDDCVGPSYYIVDQ